MIPHVVIVGGGFSGASAAVQLVRRSPAAVRVTVVEPRAEIGRGLAYSATDPDHRLNAPVDRHVLDPDDPAELARWMAAQEVLRHDPEARWSDGRCFLRRRDFGRFVGEAVQAHSSGPNGSTIGHLRDHALRVAPEGRGWRVHTAGGQAARADLLIVATGNPPPRLPAFVAADAAACRGVIGDPMDVARIRAEVAPDDRVLVLGSGLTALDVLSTLLRGGHRGPITVVSRHGLRPRGQAPLQEQPAAPSPYAIYDPPGGPLPAYIAALGAQPRLRELLRALRRQVRADALAGRSWHAAFGALRDGVWRVWPEVREADKRRFVRHLKVWYDVHRFLAPPQNEAMVQAAAQAGAVRFRALRVRRIDATTGGALQLHGVAHAGAAEVVEPFDALVNCTGIDGSGAGTLNPVLRAGLADGWLQPGPAGLGFAVDGALRALGRDGVARDTLRVIGPPSLGACGDPIGAAFIAMHLRRAMPGLLATLHGAGPGPGTADAKARAGRA